MSLSAVSRSPVAGFDAITLLGHRRRHDLRSRVGDCFEHFVELRRRVKSGVQRTNKTPIDLFAVALEHAVEKILRNERFCY